MFSEVMSTKNNSGNKESRAQRKQRKLREAGERDAQMKQGPRGRHSMIGIKKK
jgi:hypothetical protein